MGNGECCSVFGERVCPFISGKSSMTGDPLEAQSYTERERVGKIPNILEGFSLEKCWGRREKGKGRLGVRQEKGRLKVT